MAENSDPHRQSLYMGKAIQQVSSEEGAMPSREPALSPDRRPASTFGREFRLKCGICLNDLDQPKQLPSCYHIFCRGCVQSIVDSATGDTVSCPLQYCGVSSAKEDLARAVRGDTYLHVSQGQFGVYVESGDVSCSVRNHESAAYFCLECGQKLCETCHSDHIDNEDIRHHAMLKLFNAHSKMTVGMHRSLESSMASSVDERDMGGSYKCPICRNTDTCEHEGWLKDLLDDSFLQNDRCPIPEHASGNELIAYCTDPGCEEPICGNCSMIEHRDHKAVNIGSTVEEKLPELSSVKKQLAFKQEYFGDAAKACDEAEDKFRNHILKVEQKMIDRKGSMHMQVEEAFKMAFNLIEQTGKKQAELNRQSEEMHQEVHFIESAIQLAERALEEGAPPLEVVRIWKGLKIILEDLEGKETKANKDPEVVLPQGIVEKRLVLPAPSCMNPDLRILQKVGVENTELQQAFFLKATDLLLFYSILPLTQTEALLSCKPRECATEVVQYSNVDQKRYSVRVGEGAESCITAVPGSGIVMTVYQTPTSCGDVQGKSEVRFWGKALGKSMTQLEAEGAGENMKVIAQTDLPPRGVAVTRDNHLVVCTAEDPPQTSGGLWENCILVMTMQGDIVRSSRRGGQGSHLQFPRYVSVNINDDICVTDEKARTVIIFNRRLEEKLRILNPYTREEFNSRFSPRGICHDSLGRLIVADSNNNAVVRIEYRDDAVEPVFETEIILMNNHNKVQDLDAPMLVAMHQGVMDQSPRLWVACRDNIQVFHYMDKD